MVEIDLGFDEASAAGLPCLCRPGRHAWACFAAHQAVLQNEQAIRHAGVVIAWDWAALAQRRWHTGSLPLALRQDTRWLAGKPSAPLVRVSPGAQGSESLSEGAF